MSNFVQNIKSILERPTLYGIESVKDLHFLLLGYSLGKPNEMKEVEELNFEKNFNQWVKQHYGLNSNQNWSSMIDFYSASSSESLNEFSNLFIEFIDG